MFDCAAEMPRQRYTRRRRCAICRCARATSARTGAMRALCLFIFAVFSDASSATFISPIATPLLYAIDAACCYYSATCYAAARRPRHDAMIFAILILMRYYAPLMEVAICDMPYYDVFFIIAFELFRHFRHRCYFRL